MSNAVDLTSYTYASAPHSAPINSTKKYRNQKENKNDNMDTTLTLMSDPRVIRGSTHLLAKKIAQSKVTMSKSQPIFPGKSNNSNQQRSNQLPRPTYDFIVKPFANEDINVMRFLTTHEEEYHNLYKTLDTQTDELLPRPESPPYIPAKVGVDIGTQIEDDTEIFDFDVEVEPLLEVIVQKTLEQSLFELTLEDELHELETLENQCRKIRFDDDEWVRLREKKVLDDRNANLKQLQDRIQEEKDQKLLKYLIAGNRIMHENLISYVDGALEKIYATGVYEKFETAVVEKEILPVVLGKTAFAIESYDSAQEVINGK